MSVRENLEKLKLNINEIKQKEEIDRDITLIAVSKQKPVEAILEAISAGQLVFGENRMQESIEKIPQIKDERVIWHFIGHLQRNKVKKAVELFDVIHSVDKEETAVEISKRCVELDKVMDIFVQVNTTGEEQKSGVDPDSLRELMKSIKSLPNLRILGLMTISLFTDDERLIRESFALLRTLRDRMRESFPDLSLDGLSMGMSGDYELAILEGASHIRVGTTIFGSRARP